MISAVTDRFSLSVAIAGLALSALVAGLGACNKPAEAPAPPPQPVAPGIYEEVKAQITEEAEAFIEKKGDLAGLCIVLVDGPAIAWAEAFGYADGVKKVAATLDAVYRVGSLTKPVTAVAVMRLVDEGRVNIDRPVQQYLPEFTLQCRFRDAAPVTPRLIMAHHSGIPSDYFKGMFREEPMSQAALVTALRDEWLAAPPGRIYSYSDVAYSVLGELIARVNDADFATYIREEVLKPIGMKTASFRLDRDIAQALVRDYKKDGEPVEDPPPRDVAAQGLYASARDMARFIQMVLGEGRAEGKRFLRPQTMAEAVRPQNEDCPCDNGYEVGLGWLLTWHGLEHLGPVAWHTGGASRCSGIILLALEHRVGVLILGHGTGSSALRHMAKKTLELAVEAKAGVAAPLEDGDVPAPETPPELLETLPGRYSTYMGFLTVKPAGDRLRMKAHGHTANLVPQHDGRFGLQYLLAGLIPIPLPFLKDYHVSFYNVDGCQFIQFHEGPDATIGEKIEPGSIPEGWQRRRGHYEVVDPGDDSEYVAALDVEIDEGYLILGITLTQVEDEVFRALMAPVSDTDAVIAGQGRRQGDRVAAFEVNGRRRLRYSGYEFEQAP